MVDNDEKTVDYAALVKNLKLWPKSWTDGNKWLPGAAGSLHEQYRNLREDLRNNANLWGYYEYCERVAFHYYNIASFTNELFRQHRVGLSGVRKWLTKCLKKLEEVPAIELSEELASLKRDAEQNLLQVNQSIQQMIDTNSNGGERKFILLGINFESSMLSQELRCQLQGLKVLEMITKLEDELSLPEQKHIIVTIDQCSCLEEIYKLANRLDLSEYYANASEKCVDKFHNMIATISVDERVNIDNIISNEIKEYKSTVEQIIEYLEDMYRKLLSSYDIAYVENKYLEYCSEFWHAEVSESLKTLTSNKNAIVIRSILDKLDSIKNLETIPDMFSESQILNLLKLLKLNEEDEKSLVQGFKQLCLECVLEFSESARIELRFIENFSNFLSISPHLEAVIVMLELKDFMRGEITLQDVLTNISKLEVNVYGDELTALQETAQCLDNSGDMFFLNEFKHVIGDFLQPVSLEVKFVDGRLTVEVTGGYIVVSKKKQELENLLEANYKIEEVRFVGAHALHIDVNFDGAVWKGKNIVVCAKLIRIHDNITWDVSGKDSDHKYTDKADAERDGSDGFAGESGGNVLLLGKRFDRAEFFTVVSNGGLGSPGQDGGDGKNGADGKGIEKKDLETKFKSLARVFYFDSDRATFLANIEQECSAKPFKWFSKYDDCYVEARTDGGNEIIYSFCNTSFITAYQNYFIYKGSHGMPGTLGGKAGLGGEGGFCGQIEIKNFEDDTTIQIATQAAKGSDGSTGQAGLNGRHGKNGWDMAYIDFETWFNPTYYGEDCKSTCTASCYEERASDRVICPYNNDKYVGITERNLEHPSQERYRNENKKQTQERQHHARAVSKKSISKSTIESNYAQKFDSKVESTLQSLQTMLDNTKQRALEAILADQEQQSKIHSEIKVERTVRYTKLKKNLGLIEPLNSNDTVLDIELVLGKIAKSHNLEEWAQLEDIEVSFEQVQSLFPMYRQLQGKNMATEILDDIEQLLMEKCRLAVLEEITSKVEIKSSSFDEVQLSACDAGKYLKQGNADSKIFHQSLGILDHCLNKKDLFESIVNYALNELQTGNGKILNNSVRRFLQDMVSESNSNVDSHYKSFKEWTDKSKQIKEDLLAKFFNEFSKLEHAECYELWQRSLRDLSLKTNFECSIQHNVELKACYKRYTDKCEEMFNCESCTSDGSFMKEYESHLRENGISGCCRELLASIFNVNIRLYEEIQEGEYSLLDGHNPSASQVVHYSFKDNKFIPLAIDCAFLDLDEQRIKEGDQYGNILAELELLEDETQVYQYLKEQIFLKHSHQLYCGEPMEQDEMDDYIDQIVAHFPDNERYLLKKRLSKIASAYENSAELIFDQLFNRFMSEGRHVSCKEMCSILNYILKSGSNESMEGNHFGWIFATHRQRDWISEILLLQLEAFFKRQINSKAVLREYLKQIKQRNTIVWLNIKLASGKSNNLVTEQLVESILKLLASIPNEAVNILELDLSEWVYALKEKYWSFKLSQLTDWGELKENIALCSYYVHSIENTYGQSKVEQLFELRVMKLLNVREIIYVLRMFYSEEWILDEFALKSLDCNDKQRWIESMQKKFITTNKERSIRQLLAITKGNKKVSNKLIGIDNVVERIRQCSNSLSISNTTEPLNIVIKNWLHEYNDKQVELSNPENLVQVLAVIVRVIQLQKSITLRDTQLLAILTMLTNDQSTLAQVSTGEGKSLIVVSVAIVKALLQNEKVDIITSSSVLAKRDAEVNRDIYSLFGIGVSHNCSEDIEKRRMAYSGNKVIYGDLSSFQRDYLLDRFYQKKILSDRDFQNVIVDEVDSMLLDKGNYMLYLSHDLANFDKLESVYIFIWQWINRPARDYEELMHTFDADAIKEAIMRNIHGLIKPEDIGKLNSELSEEGRRIIWNKLVKAGIVDLDSKLCVKNIEWEFIKDLLKPEFERYTDRVCFLIKECIEREKHIHIPNHLMPFVEQHLDSWIMSAKTAFYMRPGQDYVVDVDRSGTRAELNPNIIILDRDTGTDQASSQWEAALHQFLQLKHGCKISLQSLKAVFTSNVSYLKLYKYLYGLTGTLGSQRERSLLEEIYSVDFVTIPTAKRKQFTEIDPILCNTQSEWIKRIVKETMEQTEKKGRSVLIICETVNGVQSLHTAFGGKAMPNIFTYTRDYEEFDNGTDENKLEPGKIIIATNLAGRGTDVKITEQLKNAGGLHVCLSFLPSNIRIEQQAFGRAARCGDKGSGQLILMDPQGQQYTNSRIIEMKKQRDAEELQRISDVKTYYEKHIRIEENLFNRFKKCYEKLKQKLNVELHAKNISTTIVKGVEFVLNRDLQGLVVKGKTELEELLLHSCLDSWVFWLDKHSTQIGKENNKLQSELNVFINKLEHLKCSKFENLTKWTKGNPSQRIKLGKFLVENNELAIAKKLFDEVIEQEPHFSEAAHYYKAYALAKQSLESPSTKRCFKRELSEAVRLFGERQTNAIRAGSIVGNIKKGNTESILQIDAFEEQQKSICEIYQTFTQSIDDVTNHEITPQTIMNDLISEEAAEKIIQKLIQKGVLKGARIAKNDKFDKLCPIADSYGFAVSYLNKIITRHKGLSIDLNSFIKVLKKEISLASRENFWKALVHQGALIGEEQYIFVALEEFKKLKPSVKSKLNKINLTIDKDDIILYQEFLEEQKNSKEVFLKNEFKKAVGKNMYDEMKKKGTITSNKKASRQVINERGVVFTNFDSIKKEDFSHIGISESESTVILEQLIEARIIIKASSQCDTFVAGENFHTFKQLNLPSCPIYEDAVIALLAATFTYRNAFQALTEASQCSQINLQVRPHQSLLGELLEHGIIKQVTAKNCNDNSEAIIEEVLFNMGITAEGATQHVLETLDRCKGSLRALKVPEGQLVSLEDFLGKGQLSNAEEVYVFSINGLDQLLKLGEKKWTWEMIRNTVIVIALGVGQIALGAIIELYSVGLMTHVGGACISEGINDIFFAAGALKSGYFSWKEYRQQKLQSLKITILSAGIGAYLSQGAKVSRYGYKLAGPHLQATGKNIAATCGKELIKEVGRGVIVKEVAKRIALKTVQGIAFGLANVGVDYMMENHLRVLCSGLAAKFLEVIDSPERYRAISANLKDIFLTLGPQEAEKVVSAVTKKVFSGKSQVDEFSSMFRSLAGGVVQGLAAAMKKCSMAGNPLEIPMQTIGKALTILEYGEHILKMATLTDVLLLQLNSRLTKEFKKRSKKENITSSGPNFDLECNRFTNKAIDDWKGMLRQQAEQIIEQNFVTPVLKKGANCLVTYAGKKIQQTYQSYKENKYSKCFEALKQQHKEDLEKVGNRDDASQAEENLKKQYHKDLLKLMKKTCSPKLFADILRENVPMDLTCVGACQQVLTEILKSRGISNPSFTIVVETDDGLRQEFSSNPNGERGVIISLVLEDGHFQTLGNANADATNNNCLCTAVLSSFNFDDVTPEQLRDQIANTVQHDQHIGNHIQQGWHKFPMNRGAFGGKAPPIQVINVELWEHEESSEHQEYVKEGDQKIVFKRRTRASHIHLKRRVPALFEYIATEQVLSMHTGIAVDELVVPGPFKYQDQSSGRGAENIDAAHLVAAQLGKNSSQLQDNHPEAHKLFAEFKGHTQNVDRVFNRGAPGKAIDRIQRDHTSMLREVNFNKTQPAPEDIDKIKIYKQSMVKSLTEICNKKRTNPRVKKEVRKALQGIKSMTPNSMFNAGRRQFVAFDKKLQNSK